MLGKLIRPASKPHASLVGNVTRLAKAEVVTSFSEANLLREWAHATGKQPATLGSPVGSLTVPEDACRFGALLSLKRALAAHNGAE